MTEVRIKGGKPTRRVAEALEGHADDLFSRPTGTWLAVVEIRHTKRTETVETADEMDYVSRQVEARISSLEIITRPEEQEAAQALMDAVMARRKAAGTLFDPANRASADVDGGDAPF